MSTITKLSAVILSDGDIDFKRHTVSFTESKEVVEAITSEFNEVNGLKIKWHIEKHHNSYRARAYSKNFAEFLQTFTKSFRTRPHGAHPFCSDKNCLNCSKKIVRFPQVYLPKMSKSDMADFLRYYITCDGGPLFGIRKRRNNGSLQIGCGIKVGCTNPSLREQIMQMLTSFGIKSSIKSDGLEIRNLKSIEKFYKQIKFLSASRVRRGKLFNGYKKNTVLRVIVICGCLTNHGHWLTRSFHDVKNAERFLLGLASIVENENMGKIDNFIKDNIKFSLSSAVNSPVSSVEWVPAQR